MKKTFLLTVLALFFFHFKTKACIIYDPDYEYYNLFMQEIINDPQYYPFLLSYSTGYYRSELKEPIKNENIEEWQTYLGLSYENTEYLVFKSTRDDLRNLANGKPANDKNLKFADNTFAAKHKQALLYLAYAKYLEPYMAITESEHDGWYYYPDNYKTAGELEYAKVTNVLERSWNAETDKELKLRYGFQLVRFAHYNRLYREALNYFDKYVESLNYKPVMYYHALNHKAGAQRALGNTTDANYNFFKVFTNSKNLKENALTSIHFTNNVDFKNFLNIAKTQNEINDVYLLLGFLDFSNPLAAIEKITGSDPDAIQAKVLMARAINQIERVYNKSDFYCKEDNCFKAVTDKRYPIVRDKDQSDINNFFKQALAISSKMAEQNKTKDKNFWNLTSAYLHFLDMNFDKAKSFLSKVDETDKKYILQKQNLAMYIDICEQPAITESVEKDIYAKYGNVLNQKFDKGIYLYKDLDYNTYSTYNFIIDVLANRYFIQGDYAKSFLMNNNIMALENNPHLDLLENIEKFYRKTNKNTLEQYILNRIYPSPYYGSERLTSEEFDVQSYIDDMKGNIYLAMGDLNAAFSFFSKVKPGYKSYTMAWDTITEVRDENNYRGFNNVSSKVFGYNRIECFECTENIVMGIDYISEYKIKPRMNKKELAQVLIQLEKEGKGKGDRAAKANYLLGNFFYNVTRTGYYRNILRFDQTNGNGEKYRINEPINIYDNIYFKNYSNNTYFKNNISTPQKYLEKAYSQADDNELKARIVFALSKCEQENHYDSNKIDGYSWWGDSGGDNILIGNRVYFKELQLYSNTNFYEEVKSNCLYFDYYVTHYIK